MQISSDLAAWLRLTLTPEIGGERQRILLNAFGGPEPVFSASLGQLSSLVGERPARKLLEHDSQAAVDAALAWAAEPGNHVLTLADAEYPRQLLQIPDPPSLLYAKGRLDLLHRPAIAIVGSRNATAQGEANAEDFARALSAAGLTIVSGLALGIDAAAHRGGLAGSASTVGVIGTGADRIYPARNRDLTHRMAREGLILSEFPLGTPAIASNFPRRNRIISGLALGVLVVEAAPQSGSLITARLAGEQGREVFAIPGSIHSPQSRGCHQLIRQGAKLVDSAADILEDLRLPAELPTPPTAETAMPAPAPEEAEVSERLLAALGHDPCDMDQLTRRTGLTPDALYAILLALELDGRIATLPGGRFQRVH